MIVVSDTSPLNYLVLIGQVDLLPTLFGRVVVPPAVLRELQHSGAPDIVRSWASHPPCWIESQAPIAQPRFEELGEGENEAIALAVQIGAELLLIDERLATTVAHSLGLKATGTLGVLDWAAERGLIELPAVVQRLRQTSFRCSDSLYAGLLRRDASRRRS